MNYHVLNQIENAGIKKVLDRGSARILEEDSRGIFLQDSTSKAYMLACEETELGEKWMIRHEQEQYKLMSLNGEETASFAKNRYQLNNILNCFQVVYQMKIAPEKQTVMKTRTAGLRDLPFIIQYYDLLSEEELRGVIGRGNLLLGMMNGETVGFAGEHLEGSMGLLFVLPKYRRSGYGADLERALIANTIRQGYVPFGQVETNNEKSLELQRKLGLSISEKHVYWLS